MAHEVTIARQCEDFEREITYPFLNGLNRTAAQQSLLILGKGALREISEYLQTRKSFDSETIEWRVQKSWCTLLSKIHQQYALPQPKHSLDNFHGWVKWLKIQ